MTTTSVKDRFRFAGVCALLCAATVVAYWPVTHAGFLVSYDDELYVTNNPHVLSGISPENLLWACTTFETGNWHPLTWVSHMLDCSLFGPRPQPPHLENLAFHLVNVVLLFCLLWAATGAGWKSAFVAALFALHPMHVESVAWISERKDVLSTMFWLLTTLCYVRYVKKREGGWYAASLACFVLGLMAKPMLVTLPFTLLVLDAWPLGRLDAPAKAAAAGRAAGRNTTPPGWRAWLPPLAEKAPFFALSAVSSIIAFVAQSNKRAVVAVSSLSPLERAANAIHSYGAYLEKLVAPVNLACFYPFPQRQPVLATLASLAVLVAISAVCLRERRRAPYLLAGWLWYLGTLVPVIGLVQVGVQAMADRYTYVPFIGPFVMIAWGISGALAQWRIPRPAIFAGATAAVFALAGVTHATAGYWKNSMTLFERAASVTRNNDVAYLNLGVALSSAGKTDSAIASFNRALAAKPGDAGVAYDAYNNLGIASARAGRTNEALSYYRRALRAAPDLPEAYFNLAAALAAAGNGLKAVENYRLGLQRDPGDFDARSNLGDLLARAAKPGEAIDEYKAALRLRPNSAATLCSLGRLLADAGHLDESIACFTKALVLRPDLTVAHINLGVAFAMKSDMNDALLHFREAIRQTPRSSEAHADCARALASMNDTAAALSQYEEAVRLDSLNVDARLNFGALLAGQGKTADAARQFGAVLAIDPGNTAAKRDLGLVTRSWGSQRR
jgi:tetratricopeptide (TPR) repeat protein